MPPLQKYSTYQLTYTIMQQTEKDALKNKIISRNELYELQGSRLKRVLKDPLRTLSFYTLQLIGYLRPFKVTYTTLWGSKMRFFLPEGGMVYYYGFWEANLTNFFINFLKEGDVFIDIGAHVGYYSVLASDLVGATGKVYAFEPTPRTFLSLSENSQAKRNMDVFNNAILNESTTIDFFDYGPKYSAFNSFKKRTAEEIFFKDDVTKISVSTISIDNFCNKNKVTPTFIKIDAEGSEYLILSAMDSLLQNVRPIVSIEVSTNKEWEENLEKSFAIFEKHGYDSYEISLGGTLKRCDAKEARFYDNLLFIHPSKLHTVSNLLV